MNRYRGTAIGQDMRWKSKQQKLLKEMKCPKILATKVRFNIYIFDVDETLTTIMNYRSIPRKSIFQ